MDPIERGRDVVRREADALATLAESLGESFGAAVARLERCAGRVVVTGVGKAGLVARKIAATLASTGAPAFYLHPADGLHGDLGMVTPNDVVIAFSNRGQSDEVLRILPYLLHFKIDLIAVTANAKSDLAKHAAITIVLPPLEEASPYVLAPTCSTAAMMALGDALAVTLLDRRGFGPDDFALRHPSGALGKRLLIKVGDVVDPENENPIVASTATVRETLNELMSYNLGAVSVVGEGGVLVGIVTDGDLKRMLMRPDFSLDQAIGEVMTPSPRTTSPDTMGVTALDQMESKRTYVLPVVSADGRPVAMLTNHHLIRAGIT